MTDIRPVSPTTAAAWLGLRHALWPEADRAAHARDIERFIAGEASMPLHVLLAFEGSRAVGLAELGIRSYAEGCATDRVAFLEGWYVVPEARRRGIGAALVAAAERWAVGQGCTELASDTEADNRVSQDAHLAVGFEEVVQIRCFRKSLPPPG
ncbi:MAG: aminoglycoside 6'-N-acetyltransferase [Dehalococcoidia bacterium]